MTDHTEKAIEAAAGALSLCNTCTGDGFDDDGNKCPECFGSGTDIRRTIAAYEAAMWNDAGRDVLAERQRQITVEGWTPEHDDEHSGGEMALAAAYYAAPVEIRCEMEVPCRCRSVGECTHQTFPETEWQRAWPWDEKWLKRKSRRENLVRAGALILAEIERLDRTAALPSLPEGGK